jgi:hypothetical protein
VEVTQWRASGYSAWEQSPRRDELITFGTGVLGIGRLDAETQRPAAPALDREIVVPELDVVVRGLVVGVYVHQNFMFGGPAAFSANDNDPLARSLAQRNFGGMTHLDSPNAA